MEALFVNRYYPTKKLFEEFYRSQYREEPKEELTALFLSAIQELEE